MRWSPGRRRASSQSRPPATAWPVGALDLRIHDDAFFAQFLTELWQSKLHGSVHDTKFAGMNMRWIPPANLVLEWAPEFGNFYRITNSEECADAANTQAEQDYAMLLSLSGYPAYSLTDFCNLISCNPAPGCQETRCNPISLR